MLLSKAAEALRRIEAGLLTGLLLAMIGVAAYQVAARNLFGGGLTWGDAMVRVSLLWLTMVGGMAAASADRHIRIDLIARFAGDRALRRIGRATSLFTACVCFALAWHSVTFIMLDYQDRTPGVGIVPAWVCELAIPLGAGVMGLRYLLRALSPARGANAAQAP